MRRPRRAVLPLAALALLLAAGCTPGEEQEECGELCVESAPVTVGMVLPLTGELAPFGQAQRRGAEAAVARVNAGGGIGDGVARRQVELLVRDTASNPDVAGQQVLILVRGPFHLLALVGPCAPPVALVRAVEARGVPLLSGCQPLPGGLGPLERTRQAAPLETERAAAVVTALTRQAPGPVALFLTHDRSDEPFRAAAAAAGVAVTGTYRPSGTDWAEAVASAVRDGARTALASTQAPAGIGLWRELERQDVRFDAAYADEAGLGSAWYDRVGTAAEGTLTDLVHPAAAGAAPPAVDDAVATVSEELTRVLLDALAGAPLHRAGVDAALAAADGTVARQPVSFAPGPHSALPYRLARWQRGVLEAVGP